LARSLNRQEKGCAQKDGRSDDQENAAQDESSGQAASDGGL
jgi:hypothetical protein